MKKKEDELPFPHCLKQLQTIKGVYFTPREIDVISFLVSGRSAKKIASSLSITTKTIEHHTSNIMSKLECNSREHIIDFIETSGNLSSLRQHYTDILIYHSFKKTLMEISKLKPKKLLSCVLIYWTGQEEEETFITYLETCLKMIGVAVSKEFREQYAPLSQLINEYEESEYVIYILPKKGIEKPINFSTAVERTSQHLEKKNRSLFLFLDEDYVEVPKEFNFLFINLSTQKNIYLAFFKILNQLFPIFNLEKNFLNFKEKFEVHCEEVLRSYENSVNQVHLKLKLSKTEVFKKNLFKRLTVFLDLVKNRKRRFVLATGAFSFILLCTFYLIHHISPPKTNGNIETIQSDLFIPGQTTLLNRPEILAEIRDKLKGSEGIRTVSLVGWGGAGKTTLARQYARQQDRPLIWEVNAETKKSLMTSLEALAYAASKTSEEKKELREIQDIKNPSEREGQLLIFLKRRLKAQPNWFLIYDNVESLTDIQAYFPHDPKIWGNGHVIITTQNTNITKNSYIENMGVLTIGELSEAEKLSLFNKIINSGESKVSSLTQEDLHKKNFLKEIPPFPLDVSTAAYYLKETQVSYDQYLAYLSTQTGFFDENQHNLLRDVGKYTKTRYAIISMSLKQIIEAHKNYKDTLVLISLIDSQNIPKELIFSYENNDFCENFLHELRKRSFIIEEAHKKESKIATFSLHRSVQNIFLSYLTKKYELQENHPSFYKILSLLERYLAEKIDQEDLIKISPLRDHCEKILTHTDILSPLFQDSLKGDLGSIYFYLGRYDEAIVLLRQSIDKLQKSQKNFYKLARLFAFLASAYIALGDVKEGIEYHRQSIALFQKYFPHHYLKIALHLTYLGNAYRDFGQYEKARETLEKAYTIFKIKSLQSNVGYARNLIDLGKVYRSLGEYKRAIPILKEGFAYYKHHLSADHFRSAWGAIHLAHTYNDVKMHHEARELLEYALLNYERNHSKNHIGVAWILTHLGYTYKEFHQYEKARLLFNRARAIYQKNVPDDHIEVAWTLVGLGSLDTTTEALRLVKKNLETYQKNYGKDHVETARVLVTLGEIYSSQGDLDKAEVYLREASQVFEKHKHPYNYMALEALAELYLKKHSHEKKNGDIQQAQSYKNQSINYLNQALEIVKTNFPEDSPHIAEISLKLEKTKNREE
ncbi:MAG: tetratricopeptide repeat protein [Alphaproteobacteria bacterium]|nr:tetratricopeptide repeat protein [Alphaproteobacteria bacterium]MBY0500551.1 tetratricopeptide repeat protein [Alphaproteobacteria bacterium]